MISASPSPSSARAALPLLRVRPSSEVDLLCISDHIVWLQTHFFSRQVLCPGAVCPACGGGEGRSHGYTIVCVRHGESRGEFLLELTPTSFQRASSLARMIGTQFCRGLQATAYRRRKNSPLHIDATGTAQVATDINGTMTRIVDAVAVLYGLPVTRSGEDTAEWAERVRHLAMVRVADAMRRSP